MRHGHITKFEIVQQQTKRMFQHIRGLGVAQRLAVQSSEIMSKPCVFSLHPCHIGLADNLVAIGNKAGVN